MRALITGAGGFAGRYLAEHLAAASDWELWGTERPHNATAPGGCHVWLPPVAAAYRAPSAGGGWAAQRRLRLVAVELTDYAGTRDLLAEVRPDYLFHLAAQAIVQRALERPGSHAGQQPRGRIKCAACGSGTGPDDRACC